MTYEEMRAVMIDYLKQEVATCQQTAKMVESKEASKYFEGRADQANNTLNLLLDLYVSEREKSV